jgi:hypothetical protein
VGERLSGPGYTPEIKTGAYTEKQPVQSQARPTKPMGQAAVRACGISNPSAQAASQPMGQAAVRASGISNNPKVMAASKPMGKAAVQAARQQSKSAGARQSMGQSAIRGSSRGRLR